MMPWSRVARSFEGGLAFRYMLVATLGTWLFGSFFLGLLWYQLEFLETAPPWLEEQVNQRVGEAEPLLKLQNNPATEDWLGAVRNQTRWRLSTGFWFVEVPLKSISIHDNENSAPTHAGDWVVERIVRGSEKITFVFNQRAFVQALRPYFLMIAIAALPVLATVFGAVSALLVLLLTRNLRRRVDALRHTILQWAGGSFDLRAESGVDQVGQVGRQLNQLIQQLEALSAQKVEHERSQWIRVLHDEVKQDVFAATLQLATIQNPTSEILLAQGALGQAQKALARLLTSEVAPQRDRFESLAGCASTLSTRWARLVEIDIRVVPTGLAQLLFQEAASEGLTNAFRHGDGGVVSLKVWVDEHAMCLEVVNRGVLSKSGFGLGLSQIKRDVERACGVCSLTADDKQIAFKVRIPNG
jgi:signal transduction histidine kinase